jgi:peptidoglycan/LPS O-acetylase OafA/YrhL
MSVAVQVPAEQRSQGRAEFLDSMRGVAALMVLYYHSSGISASLHPLPGRFERLIEQTVGQYIDFGWAGVVLFFCISGFIIPLSFRSQVRPALSFVVSRLFRLFPAFWLGLVLSLTVAVALGAHYKLSTILANFTMLETIFGKEDILKVSWTLFIEWIFYTFCFFAFLTGKLGQTRFSYVVATVILALANLMSIIRFYTHRHFLPVGIMFALSLMIWASLWRNYQWKQD